MKLSEDDFRGIVKSVIDRVAEDSRAQNGLVDIEVQEDEIAAIQYSLYARISSVVNGMWGQIFVRRRTIDQCEVPYNPHPAYKDDIKTCAQGHKICNIHHLGKCPTCGCRI